MIGLAGQDLVSPIQLLEQHHSRELVRQLRKKVATHQPRGQSILVVDDDPSIRSLLRLTAQPVRFAAAGFGLLLILGSLAKLIQLTVNWAGDKVFTDTHALVLSSAVGVLGLQILSAVLFISIFSGRLGRFEDESG